VQTRPAAEAPRRIERRRAEPFFILTQPTPDPSRTAMPEPPAGQRQPFWPDLHADGSLICAAQLRQS